MQTERMSAKIWHADLEPVQIEMQSISRSADPITAGQLVRLNLTCFAVSIGCVIFRSLICGVEYEAWLTGVSGISHISA